MRVELELEWKWKLKWRKNEFSKKSKQKQTKLTNTHINTTPTPTHFPNTQHGPSNWRRKNPRPAVPRRPAPRHPSNVQGQGFPGRNEAAQLPGWSGLPREQQEPPRPWRDGELPGSGTGLEGEEDGGEDGGGYGYRAKCEGAQD